MHVTNELINILDTGLRQIYSFPKLQKIFLLTSEVLLGLPSDLSPREFLTKILYKTGKVVPVHYIM
jgi:hypothetical protein